MDATKPTIVFVCVKNGGKSQMAAALTRLHARDRIDVYSAGTHPGAKLNAASAASVEELGATFEGEYPKPLDADLLRRADRIIVIGDEAHVEPIDGMHATIETWHTDEPSERGIEGTERMNLIRDDLDARCRDLIATL